MLSNTLVLPGDMARVLACFRKPSGTQSTATFQSDSGQFVH